MSEESLWIWLFILILAGAVTIARVTGIESGKEIGRRESERACVDAGRAEYYLDGNNERQWRWKSLPPQ